ncbi:MAG: preprotein translocase subunit YajC [Nitrospirota bacterium]
MVKTVLQWIAAPAWAQAPSGGGPAAPGGGPAGLISFIPFLLIFVLFYVLMILPQQRQRKKHQAMLAALKKGDRVVTSSGLIGSITNIHDDVVTLQIAENVKVKMLRSAIASLRTDAESGS